MRKIPAHIREQQINDLPNITFVRWDGEYRNCNSKAVCRCDVDGFEWSVAVTHLVHRDRTGCPKCGGTSPVSASERIEQIDNLPNITFVKWCGEYRNKKSKAVCRCDIDGFEWSVSVDDLINRGRGCPQCVGLRRWTASERVDQIDALPNINFVRWDGRFQGSRSKAVCRCDIDGFEWSVTVGSLLSLGTGCPNCAVSGYNPSKPGTLYALRSECGTMVKIGISNDHHRRHRELVARTPFAFNCVELCHGDGAMVATLEKVLHGLMEPVVFDTPFDGSTEWRKWDARLPEWFDLYRHWS